MSLFDELDAASTGRGPVCGVDLILRSMSADQRSEWIEAIGRERAPGIYKYAASDLAKALEKRGYSIRAETIGRHRRGTASVSRRRVSR